MSPSCPSFRALALCAAVLLSVVSPASAHPSARRGDPEQDAVEASLGRRTASPSERAEAARRLVELKGGKAAGDLVDVALQATTPYELQCLLADVLAGLPRERFSDKAQAELRKLVGDERARTTHRLFALRALAPLADAREGKTLLQAFEDEDPLVRQAALDTGVRLAPTFVVEALRDLLASTRKEDTERPSGGAWLAALDALVGHEPDFVGELFAATEAPLRSTRTTAVRLLAARLPASVDADPSAEPDDEAQLRTDDGPARGAAPDASTPQLAAEDARLAPLLARFLAAEHWSERLAGLALARRVPPLVAVPALLERYAVQSGRLAVEFDGALAALTGQAISDDLTRWSDWWTRVGRPALLGPEPEDEEPARPRASTLDRRGGGSRAEALARFFDLEIASHNLVFVIDISGSMEWPASFRGDPGRRPPPPVEGEPTRMALAREQLAAALAGMDAHARYNLVAFNDRARPWLTREGMSEFGKAGKRTDDAREYLDALSPNGGTNLYDGLRAAFDDPDVDTIYLLSDGVPSQGEFVVPELIRRSVDAWNAHRHVTVHSLVMGLDAESHPLARQLAEDSGGQYVELP